MAGRTAYEAVAAFLDSLQQAVSCVSGAVLNVYGGYYPRAEPHILILGDGGPVRLPGEHSLALVVKMQYRVARASGEHGPWKVGIMAYYFQLVDGIGREIVAYHWHPGGRSQVARPHLYLGTGAQVGYPAVAAAHLPTGHVALEDVLRCAIADFGVRPGRRDWAEVLDRAQRAFE